MRAKTALILILTFAMLLVFGASPAFGGGNGGGGQAISVLGVALHSGTAEDVAGFVREHRVQYPTVLGDDDLGERFEVVGFPTYFLFAPDGTVARQYIGKLDEVLDDLRRDIDALKRRGEHTGKEVSR